jgi:glycosyltransferase involved in cell wall biosynthesis
MKVLHVYRTYYPDQPSGIAEAIRQTCLATRPLGVESTIFTLSPNWRNCRAAPEAKVIRERSWAAPSSCDLGGPGAFRTFKRLAAETDVIHYHEPWPFGDLLHLAARPQATAVMTWHSDVVRQKAFRLLYAPLLRATARKMSLIAATSPAYLQTSPVLSDASLRGKVRVVPLGISEEAVPPPAKTHFSSFAPSDEPFILFLGALRYYKGVDILLDAAKRTKGTIVIAGGGPERRRLRRRTLSEGIKNVLFLDHVDEPVKMALLRSCRALVLPSHLRSEAFGLALVEAAMCAKPMISCEIGTGTSFVNIDGETGVVTPPASPGALADAMQQLLDDDGLAGRLGTGARQRYERLFSGECVGRNNLAFYEEAVSGCISNSRPS